MHRFHVVGLPHTKTSKHTNTCAYTVKVYNYCAMMSSLGHQVFHYGAEGSDPECTEHITIISTAEQQKLHSGLPHHLQWDPSQPIWQLCNNKAIAEISKRVKPNDFLCLIGGLSQKSIADAVPSALAVEYGIGYSGIFANHKVFESYSHMHLMYGQKGCDPDGQFYDCVIPNSFNVADFPFCETPGDYYLFLGRLIARKGVGIAATAAKTAGVKLIIAGPGGTVENGVIKCEDGTPLDSGDIEYVGPANVEQRAILMGKAKALYVPTIYCEPFGGVVVEGALCGTPCISTDFGVFSETVQHGVTGYRCHTLEQFVWATKNVEKLDRAAIRTRAVANWSTDRVKYMYNEYFDMLAGLWDGGWYRPNPGRTELDWLRRMP